MKHKINKLIDSDQIRPVTEESFPEFFVNLQYTLLHILREMEYITDNTFQEAIFKLP
jgi:hypothetical protein